MAPITRSATGKRKATDFYVPPATTTKKRQKSTRSQPNGRPASQKLTAFPLLSLPRELRDNVYRMVFEGGLKILSRRISYCTLRLHFSEGRELAMSCRQVLREIKEHLVRSDSITICLGLGYIMNPTSFVASTLLSGLSPELMSMFYKRGVRVRHERTSARAFVYDRRSGNHPSLEFVIQSLKWTPHVTNWIVETRIDVWDRHLHGGIGLAVLWQTNPRQYKQTIDKSREDGAQMEAKHWEYTLNEFRRKSYRGQWKCTVENWESLGPFQLKVCIRCVKTLPSTGGT